MGLGREFVEDRVARRFRFAIASVIRGDGRGLGVISGVEERCGEVEVVVEEVEITEGGGSRA